MFGSLEVIYGINKAILEDIELHSANKVQFQTGFQVAIEKIREIIKVYKN